MYEDPVETAQDIIEKDYTLFGNVGEITHLRYKKLMKKPVMIDTTFDLGQEHYIDLLKDSPNKYFKQLSEALFSKENQGLLLFSLLFSGDYFSSKL